MSVRMHGCRKPEAQEMPEGAGWKCPDCWTSWALTMLPWGLTWVRKGSSGVSPWERSERKRLRKKDAE